MAESEARAVVGGGNGGVELREGTREIGLMCFKKPVKKAKDA